MVVYNVLLPITMRHTTPFAVGELLDEGWRAGHSWLTRPAVKRFLDRQSRHGGRLVKLSTTSYQATMDEATQVELARLDQSRRELHQLAKDKMEAHGMFD